MSANQHSHSYVNLLRGVRGEGATFPGTRSSLGMWGGVRRGGGEIYTMACEGQVPGLGGGCRSWIEMIIGTCNKYYTLTFDVWTAGIYRASRSTELVVQEILLHGNCDSFILPEWYKRDLSLLLLSSSWLPLSWLGEILLRDASGNSFLMASELWLRFGSKYL